MPSFRFFVPGEHANVPSFRFFVPGEHPNVPSFRFSFRGNIRQNHPFGNSSKPRGPNDQKNLIPIEIFNLDRNFLIPLENFNLDVSISPTKIGPRWVARSKISFSIEIFNLDRNLDFSLIFGPSGFWVPPIFGTVPLFPTLPHCGTLSQAMFRSEGFKWGVGSVGGWICKIGGAPFLPAT